MKHLVFGVWASVLAAALLSGAAQTAVQAGDSPAIARVRALDEALNGHDATSALELMTTSAAIGEQPFVDELIRQQIHLTLVDQPTLSEDAPSAATSVAWRAELDLQMYRARGVDFVPATLHATVASGRISFLSIRPDSTWTALLGLQDLT